MFRLEQDKIKDQWKRYFDNIMLNRDNSGKIVNDKVLNRGLTSGIIWENIEVALERMKTENTTGLDGILMELWECFED